MLVYDGMVSHRGKMLLSKPPRGVTKAQCVRDQKVIDAVWLALGVSTSVDAVAATYTQAPNGTTHLSLIWEANRTSPGVVFAWGNPGRLNLMATVGRTVNGVGHPVALVDCHQADYPGQPRYDEDIKAAVDRVCQQVMTMTAADTKAKHWSRTKLGKIEAMEFIVGLNRRRPPGRMPSASRVSEMMAQVMAVKGGTLSLLDLAAVYGKVVQDRSTPLGQLYQLRMFTECADQDWPADGKKGKAA